MPWSLPSRMIYLMSSVSTFHLVRLTKAKQIHITQKTVLLGAHLITTFPDWINKGF